MSSTLFSFFGECIWDGSELLIPTQVSQCSHRAGSLNVTISVASSTTGNSRPCDVIEWTETLTSARCLQMYVGDSVYVRRDASSTLETSERDMTEVRVFGRIFNKRKFGGVCLFFGVYFW